MEGSTIEDTESWEVADVDESMKRLMLPSAKQSSSSSSSSSPSPSTSSSPAGDDLASGSKARDSEEIVNQVDQFLRDALQNPRERLAILRMEQDVEKFIQDPTREQMEFRQLPTSYLRLAAHRIAQHYFLQSMVLMDDSIPDGPSSRIIICKTSTECRSPRIRLADIPVSLPQDNSGVLKVAIKRRPQKHSPGVGSGNLSSVKGNHSKTVEERKEEYNRARARIFNSTNHCGLVAKQENVPKKVENLQLGSVVTSKVDEKTSIGSSVLCNGRRTVDSSSGSSSTPEKDPVSRYTPSNRVAIFRNRETDRHDPDYDRGYDRYMQRFDPGFGFNSGPYSVQPMYTPALNYNTEFPQLGSNHRPQVSTEPPRPSTQHLPGPRVCPTNPVGVGYGHPDNMLTAYTPSHFNARSTSALYLHSAQYLCQQPGMAFVNPHEHVLRPYLQFQQQQHDATLGLARPH